MAAPPPLQAQSNSSLPWVSDPIAQGVQTYTQIAYPILILLLYLFTFVIRSVATARNGNEHEPQDQQLGPGGKPLPTKNPNNSKEPDVPHYLDFSKPRKLLFEWLSVGVIFSLAGNIVVVIIHALYARKEKWWCGQAPTVRRERQPRT